MLYFEHEMLHFLRSIGNFENTSGTHHKMHVEVSNAEGHFGVISADTHNFYEAYPAPLFALARIEQDLIYSEDPNVYPLWEIENLRPVKAQDRRGAEEYENEVQHPQDELDLPAIDGVEDKEEGPADRRDNPNVRVRDLPTS